MVQKYPVPLRILNLQQSMTTDQAIRSLVQYRENFPLEIDYDLIEYLAYTSVISETKRTPFEALFSLYFLLLEENSEFYSRESVGIGFI